MSSLKVLVVFFAVLTVCYCHSMKKKKHKYDMYWHGFHYLTFLALKLKFLFILGGIFTVGLVAGKFFAILKLVEYMKKTPHDDHHSEKVVYVSPHGSGGYPPVDSFSQPSPGFGQPYSNGGGSYHESFPPGFSLDQPPPGAELADGGGHFNGQGQGLGGNYGQGQGLGANYGQGSPHGYGRSDSAGNHSISGYFNLFQNMIRKFNVTNITFNELNLKSDACRRKFVCEADFSSRKNIILKLAFNMLSDDNYVRYKTRDNITSLEDCSDLYSDCSEVT